MEIPWVLTIKSIHFLVCLSTFVILPLVPYTLSLYLPNVIQTWIHFKCEKGIKNTQIFSTASSLLSFFSSIFVAHLLFLSKFYTNMDEFHMKKGKRNAHIFSAVLSLLCFVRFVSPQRIF